jgi:UDP-glucose 4-epimerase
VDDLIEGMVGMMNNSEGWIGPVNLGNPNEFTILELAEKVIRLTGSQSQIVHKPLPADDPTQRRPNIDLARHRLGWQPLVEIEKGLVHTIDYFKKLIAENTNLYIVDSRRVEKMEADSVRIAACTKHRERSAYPKCGAGMPYPA